MGLLRKIKSGLLLCNILLSLLLTSLLPVVVYGGQGHDSAGSSVSNDFLNTLSGQEWAWLPVRYEHGFNYTLFWQALAVFAAILLALILWNRKLVGEIKHRKEAEAALRESEDKFKYVFDNSITGKSITLPSGEINVNDSFCKMLGYSKEELVNKKWQDLTHPEDILMTRNALDSIISGEKDSLRLIKRFLHKNGSIVWADVGTSLRHDKDGKPLYFMTSVSDITERKKAEKELQALSSRQDAILAAVPDIIMEVDADKTYTWANRAGLEFFGEDAIGKEAQYYFEGEQYTYDQVQPLFSGNESIIYLESLQRRRDGQKRLLAWWCRVLKDKDGKTTGALSTARDITEQKLAEEELRESEKTFSEMFLKSPVTIILTTPYDGKILDVNETFLRDMEYTRDEVIGHRTVELGIFHDLNDREQVIALLKNNGMVFGYECRFRSNSGKMMIGLLSIVFIKVKGKMCQLNTVIDITDRKHAEEREKHLNAILKAIRNVNQLITKERDRDRLLQGACENMVATRGFNSSWIVTLDRTAKPVSLSESGLKNVSLKLKEIFERGDLPQCAKTALAGPGIVIIDDVPVQCAGCPIKPGYGGNAAFCVRLEKDGIIYGLLHASVPHEFADDLQESSLFQEIGEDIAFALYNIDQEEKRIKMEKELKDSEVRYLTLFENIPEGILITETHTMKFRYANPAICHMLGYSEDELKDMTPKDIHSSEVMEHISAEFKEHEREGSSMVQQDIEYIKKDGTVLYADVVTAPRIFIDGNFHSATFLIDVTDRINVAAEKKKLEMQLWQSQKMEAIGRLSGAIAHDFNNILTTIIGNSEVALMRLMKMEKDSDFKELLEDIRLAGEKAAMLTRQLLAFSRKQMLQTKIFDLNYVVSEMDKLLQRLIGEDIELVTRLSPELDMVETDPGQVEQIIMNLAVNAKDAMPNGGKLTIETANVELNEEYAKSHFPIIPGNYEMISVSDTGIGMSKEVQSHLFEPFFTTKAKGKGTGLGLSIVYGIVKQSNGYIWVYSEQGKGTTIKIYLPRIDKTAHVQEKPEKLPHESFKGSETIMVVEDDAMIMKMVVKVLTGSGYKVLTAADGNEALRISEKHEGPIHLILTDVIMPGMGGRELANRLMDIRPDTKILYMSGYTDNAIVHHGVLDKGLSFIQKPFTSHCLRKKVREVMGIED